MGEINRREVLKIGAVTLGAEFLHPPLRAQTRQPKRVIIAGGGIAGLCCGYELMKRGHEVTILEASGRPGGHVRTIHDPLPDGLYADVGAEHFTKPGYDLYWNYVREFGLTALYYPRREHMLRFIGGKMYTEEILADPEILKRLGFNQREVEFLRREPWWNFATLYYKPYLDRFSDEYNPFNAGLDDLDKITFADLLERDHASNAAIGFIGSSASALHVLWHAAILNLRGVPVYPPKVYRLRGGNQLMTDTFAQRLGERVRVGSPVTGIEHNAAHVTVSYREFGKEKKKDAEFLVCCMSAVMLRQIPVKPPWTEDKGYAVQNMPYYSVARVVFQSRTKFWLTDKISPNMEFGEPRLNDAWPMSEDVATERGILESTVAALTTPEEATSTYRKYYPGRSEDIEQTICHDWSRDPWAMACETVQYKPGELRRIWPAVMEPVGRIYFAGAYTDNLNWGQEAATRSANRIAEAIDKA